MDGWMDGWMGGCVCVYASCADATHKRRFIPSVS